MGLLEAFSAVNLMHWPIAKTYDCPLSIAVSHAFNFLLVTVWSS